MVDARDDYPNEPDNYRQVLFTTLEARTQKDNKVMGGWKVLRFRPDKNYPNNFTTAQSMIDTIFNSNVTKEDLIDKLCKPQGQNPEKKLKLV